MVRTLEQRLEALENKLLPSIIDLAEKFKLREQISKARVPRVAKALTSDELKQISKTSYVRQTDKGNISIFRKEDFKYIGHRRVTPEIKKEIESLDKWAINKGDKTIYGLSTRKAKEPIPLEPKKETLRQQFPQYTKHHRVVKYKNAKGVTVKKRITYKMFDTKSARALQRAIRKGKIPVPKRGREVHIKGGRATTVTGVGVAMAPVISTSSGT